MEDESVVGEGPPLVDPLELLEASIGRLENLVAQDFAGLHEQLVTLAEGMLSTGSAVLYQGTRIFEMEEQIRRIAQHLGVSTETQVGS